MGPEDHQDLHVSLSGAVALQRSARLQRNTCAFLTQKGVELYSYTLAAFSVLMESSHIWSGRGGPRLNNYSPTIEILMISVDKSQGL